MVERHNDMTLSSEKEKTLFSLWFVSIGIQYTGKEDF